MSYIDKIDKSWTCFNNLKNKINVIEDYYKKGQIEPKIEYLFEPFNININDIKVVIIGQDPYPNGEGIGYAFAYDDFYPKPKSFKTLEKEIGHELSPTLQEWKDKGVMSVNASMTVIKHKPMSQFKDWKNFTTTWIKFLDNKRKNIQFVFLGAQPRKYSNLILFNEILTAPHPAARYGQFIGCDIFKKININL